jgi:hypothetical protein
MSGSTKRQCNRALAPCTSPELIYGPCRPATQGSPTIYYVGCFNLKQLRARALQGWRSSSRCRPARRTAAGPMRTK